VVSTLAGSITAGNSDGAGTTANFNGPYYVAADASGNVFVADTGNHRIRKITPSGFVSTVAGSSDGYANGTGTAAMFNTPRGIAVDTSGNLYVGDSANHRIRKITPGGVVSTLAGSGNRDSINGPGSTASFYYPIGVAVNNQGDVYVADSSNNLIRKITPAGVVSTLAGSYGGFADGTGVRAQFEYPVGVAVNANGEVFVADRSNNLIRKITPAGVVTTLAGWTAGYLDGTGTAASLNYCLGVAVDGSGAVFVADTGNLRIRKITPEGVVSTVAGAGTEGDVDGTGTAATFDSPIGVTVDVNGNLYVSEDYNNRIRKITPL
jgi:streptogramin lyase